MSCSEAESQLRDSGNVSENNDGSSDDHHFWACQPGNCPGHSAVRKRFECNICGYKSSKKSNLQKHMRTHTGEKPFQCFICESRFSQKDHLQTHMRIHTGEKPFQCKMCSFKCSRKNNLRRHINIHIRKNATLAGKST